MILGCVFSASVIFWFCSCLFFRRSTTSWNSRLCKAWHFLQQCIFFRYDRCFQQIYHVTKGTCPVSKMMFEIEAADDKVENFGVSVDGHGLESGIFVGPFVDLRWDEPRLCLCHCFSSRSVDTHCCSSFWWNVLFAVQGCLTPFLLVPSHCTEECGGSRCCIPSPAPPKNYCHKAFHCTANGMSGEIIWWGNFFSSEKKKKSLIQASLLFLFCIFVLQKTHCSHTPVQRGNTDTPKTM